MSTAASFLDYSTEPEPITLTFGKHRGVPLADVETSYLEWVLKADRITPELKAAVSKELASRGPVVTKVQDRWRAPAGIPKATIEMARILVEAGADAMHCAVTDQALTGAAVLLRKCLDAIELESDPGTLKPF